MPAEIRQTYAYWIRNEATNSQLEAIQKDGDRIRKELTRLRTRERELVARMAEVAKLIDPNRRGGVSHFELEEAAALLASQAATQAPVNTLSRSITLSGLPGQACEVCGRVDDNHMQDKRHQQAKQGEEREG